MGSISVSMIVKNEESCIATALESVKDADEIIVCDTGSTDRTIEIAKQYTDKVYTDYTWNDNFAEARNHAASKCTKDYILIIDADEYLEPGAMQHLREFDGDALNFHTISAINGQMHQSIRLHRNNPAIRWKGAAHNYLNIEPSHASAVKMYYHYSKAHALDPDRTLRILTKQIEANGDTPRELYYLAGEYVDRQNTEKAIEMYERYIAIAPKSPEYADALIMLARLKAPTDKTAAKRHTLEAIYINPDFKEAHEVMGYLSEGTDRLRWHAFAEKCENSNVLFVRDNKRIKVTLLAVEDFAGSGYRMMQAVRKANPIDVDIEAFVVNKSAFGLPCGFSVAEAGMQTVQDRIMRSDIIHFKGDFVHNDRWPDEVNGLMLPPRDKCKRIYTVGGSFFRRHGHKYISKPVAEIEDYKADLLTALTPDLIYFDEWMYTPHPWLTFDYRWKRGDKFIITHAPSDPLKKNSKLLYDAMRIINDQRSDVDFRVLLNLSNAEVLAAKSESHIYCDQFLCDVYANATLEALGYGVPVVTLLGNYYADDCPIQSPAELTPEALAETITDMLDWDYLESLSKVSFDYAQRVHGSVGSEWVKIYKSLCQNQKQPQLSTTTTL